ncbi:MAG TPA: hypothetical protein VGP08_22830 [Pyrinomonadaceae bacterium]|nr:hypothetical protein [Pyrinomonadaceae bacterium]
MAVRNSVPSRQLFLHPSSFILHPFCLLLAILFALALSAQPKPPQSKPSETKSSDSFQKAKGVPADAPREFEFALGRFSYRVRANGNGQRVKGEDVRRFALHLGPDEDIKYMYFAKYAGGILLTCEVLGKYGGTSYAVRLDQPSMRARWTTNVPATETGEPARDGSRLYVTGKRFAGAFDLETGELLWYVDKFPGDAAEFESFDAPEPRGREVQFRTRPVYNGRARTVVVESKTGKILRVE